MNRWIHAGHVVRALKKHQLVVFILVLQTAFSFSIICNVAFMVGQRYEEKNHETGIQENGLATFNVSEIDGSSASSWAKTSSALRLIQNTGGVVGASAAQSTPLNESTLNVTVSLQGGAAKDTGTQISLYSFPRGFMETAGIRPAVGRTFLPEEYMGESSATPSSQHPGVIMLSQQLADRLFGEASALGKTVYLDGAPATIVGVVKHLLSPSPALGAENEMTAIVPVFPDASSLTFILRTNPANLDEDLRAAAASLHAHYPSWVISDVQSYSALKRKYYQHDTAMLKLMIASLFAVIVVLMVGIAGLVGFWVSKRSRTVGIRRALGASRGAIVAMFLFENLVVVIFGLLFGCAAAIGLNMYLIKAFGEAPITFVYFVLAAMVLLAATQIACFAPSRRASRVAPASAMRNS